jgi:hypothetical protein
MRAGTWKATARNQLRVLRNRYLALRDLEATEPPGSTRLDAAVVACVGDIAKLCEGQGRKLPPLIRNLERALYRVGRLRFPRRIFVAMPFDPQFDRLWQNLVRKAIEDAGYEGLRVDEIPRSSSIWSDIAGGIQASRAIIADLTALNANVMLELGYACGSAKHFILITQSIAALPSDLRDIRAIQYNRARAGETNLLGRLKDYLARYREEEQRFYGLLA